MSQSGPPGPGTSQTVERKWGARVGMWWWEQAGIDLEGSMETAVAAAEADEDGLEE